MIYILKLIGSVLIVAFMSGCAYFNTYHNEDKNSSPGNTAVDAKQRFLIYGNAPDATVTKRFVNGKLTEVTGERLIYCAEPSPDAFSAFTASFDLSAVKPEVAEAALKGTFGESAATIGIRTQSIQLLRDAMYRSCEAYLAGAIEKSDFATLQKSYQKSMVTLVAIEQLARAVAPGQVIINTTADRTASQNIVELKKMLDKSTANVTELTVKKTEFDDELASSKNSLIDKIKKPDGNKPGNFDEAKLLCEGDLGKENEGCIEYFALVSGQKLAVSTLENEKAVEKKLKDTFDKTNNDPNLSVEATASISYNLKAAQQSAVVSGHVANTVQALVSMVYMDDFVQACIGKVAAIERRVENIKDVQPNVNSGKIYSQKFLRDLKIATGSDQPEFFESRSSFSTATITTDEADDLKNELLQKINDKAAATEASCDKVISAYATALAKAASIL